MDLSRREFFRRLGSKETARKLTGFVWQGLEGLLGSGMGAGGSVEEAGRALRNMRRKRSQRFTRPKISATGKEEKIQACGKSDTQRGHAALTPTEDKRPPGSNGVSGVFVK